MQGEINPKDVPQMMRDGTLEFGMKLEFTTIAKQDGDWRFQGIDKDNRFIAQHYLDGDIGIFKNARFPQPKLRDGDPVFCWDFDQVWEEKRHFEKFVDDMVIAYTGSSFTGKVKYSYHNWRYPTKQELSEAGYSAEAIYEITTRWGTGDCK